MKTIKKERRMIKRLEYTKKNFLNKIRFGILYLMVQVRIGLLGSALVRRRGIKSFLPLFFGAFLFTLPGFLCAQTEEWPWVFVGENVQLTTNFSDDGAPAIAAGDPSQGIYLVVWSKNTVRGFDIYGMVITKDGEIVKQQGDGEIPICVAPNDQMYPVVSWNGVNFLVVWQDLRSGRRWDIYGTRVTPEGLVLDSDGFPISIGKLTYDQSSPALSFDGENHIVVWQGKRNFRTSNIYYVRISKQGGLLEKNPVPLSPSLKDQASPAVGFDGDNYLIVWQEKRRGKFWDIVGSRVTPLGDIRDPDAVPITYSDDFGQDRWMPVLSWNGTTYLVVWMVSRTTDHWTLFGKRVGPNFDNIDLVDIWIEKQGVNKAFPAILRDGSKHLLVWEEVTEGSANIFGGSVNPYERSVHSSETFLISNKEGVSDGSLPAVAGFDDTAYIVWQAKSQEGYWQIYGQLLKK
jgi:hypothetical protein